MLISTTGGVPEGLVISFWALSTPMRGAPSTNKVTCAPGTTLRMVTDAAPVSTGPTTLGIGKGSGTGFTTRGDDCPLALQPCCVTKIDCPALNGGFTVVGKFAVVATTGLQSGNAVEPENTWIRLPTCAPSIFTLVAQAINGGSILGAG